MEPLGKDDLLYITPCMCVWEKTEEPASFMQFKWVPAADNMDFRKEIKEALRFKGWERSKVLEKRFRVLGAGLLGCSFGRGSAWLRSLAFQRVRRILWTMNSFTVRATMRLCTSHLYVYRRRQQNPDTLNPEP